MSDWNTHLYCATKVNEELKFTGKNLDLFLYGNLFPDINMGWIITPKVKLRQRDTHFDEMGQGYFWAPLRFYDKYKDQIKAGNPLFLGYLFHIWLDVKFMTDFVSRMPMSEMINKREIARERKWKDARLYIKDKHFNLSTDHLDDIANAAKEIENVSVTIEDLKLVADYVENHVDDAIEDTYVVYSESVFDKFYEEVCGDFIGWVKGEIQ